MVEEFPWRKDKYLLYTINYCFGSSFFYSFAVRKMEGLSSSLERTGPIFHCLTSGRVADLIHLLHLHRNHTHLEMRAEKVSFLSLCWNVSGFCIILLWWSLSISIRGISQNIKTLSLFFILLLISHDNLWLGRGSWCRANEEWSALYTKPKHK